MNWIQALLIVSVLVLLVYLLRSRRSARSKAWVKVGYVLFVIAGIYAILRPDDTTVVANWLGVARGADLMEYMLIIAFVFTTLSAYMRFKDLELKYARLARAVALAERQGARGALERLPEVVHRSGDAVGEIDLRCPPEHLLRAAVVQTRALQIAEPRRVELGFVATVGSRRDLRMQLPHRGFHSGADVESLASARLACSLHERVDDVVDEHVVAGVGAVAEDLGRPARQQRLREDRHHACLAVGVLTGPVHVGRRDV